MLYRSRHIQLDGCFNLRDVGGYRTRGGARTVWGRLFRGGALSRVAPGTAEELVRTHGIRQVVDLRTGEERRRDAATLPAPCQVITAPLFTTFQTTWIQPDDLGPEATAARYFAMLQSGLPTVRRVLESLRDVDSTPTLIHCAVGRDRTGIVMAVLLDLLDVTDDVIAEDYALSDAVVDDGQRARPETIHLLLSLLRSRHTSTRDMLIGAGVSPDLICQLRGALLDTA